MTYVISKAFEFAASHQLNGLSVDHKCSRLHGHNYRVLLELACEDTDLTDVGFVRDFSDLDGFRAYLMDNFDHRHLNNVVDFNPTAENLARHLFDFAGDLWGLQVTGVTVWETPNSCARYQP